MKLLSKGKKAANAWLKSHGQVLTSDQFVPSTERFTNLLKGNGLTPKSVFDIGVAEGTPWLYDAFPAAKFFLVDPTRESLPHMERWAKKINAEPHPVALGAEAGSISIHMRDTIKHASLMTDITAPNITESYEVPVETFDSRFPSFDQPAFCKIDVEGAELSVLRGMKTSMKKFAAIVVETSMNSLYKDGPEFFDIMSFMADHDMVFSDFIGMSRRPYDMALHQVDAVFVPRDSSLRSKIWE